MLVLIQTIFFGLLGHAFFNCLRVSRQDSSIKQRCFTPGHTLYRSFVCRLTSSALPSFLLLYYSTTAVHYAISHRPVGPQPSRRMHTRCARARTPLRLGSTSPKPTTQARPWKTRFPKRQRRHSSFRGRPPCPRPGRYGDRGWPTGPLLWRHCSRSRRRRGWQLVYRQAGGQRVWALVRPTRTLRLHAAFVCWGCQHGTDESDRPDDWKAV